MSGSIQISSFEGTLEIQRILGEISGNTGPTVIAIGGIHGNEKAGVQALLNVFEDLKTNNIPLKGNFYGIAGNLNALHKNRRFINVDLNRIWTQNDLQNLDKKEHYHVERVEQKELYEMIKSIISREKGPFYFLDLHTTSASTQPFITISDALNNRKFAAHFHIPIILGIEEYLDEPFLSYINKFGHIALGFEGGQHEDYNSVLATESFLFIALIKSKCVDKNQIHDYEKHEHRLKGFKKEAAFLEIKYRYEITNGSNFKMLPGFKNFDEVYMNQHLAYDNRKFIKAAFTGEIFLPLYQEKGTDGFFIIRKTSRKWLKISKWIRRLSLHIFLRFLPGVKKHKSLKNTLIINPKIANFFTTDFFHLFGYRKKMLQNNKWLFTKRDKRVRNMI